MKNVSGIVIGAVSVFLLSSTAWSDAPLGVGSADPFSSFCRGQIVVGPPGDFAPALDGTYGVMFVQLGDAKVVYSNSANGNRSIGRGRLHGRTRRGYSGE